MKDRHIGQHSQCDQPADIVGHTGTEQAVLSRASCTADLVSLGASSVRVRATISSPIDAPPEGDQAPPRS